MSSSYTFSASDTQTFTLTHAKHMAAKVATDLKRMQRLYGSPSDASIEAYENEAIALLKAGYFGVMTLGFRKDGQWIEPTLRYTAHDLAGASANDDDPGRVQPGATISGASFYSYLTYSSAWDKLTSAEQEAFKRTLPHQRTGATEPPVNGQLVADKTYSSGGRSLTRMTVKAWS
ncbi:MAG: hypothetical protein QM698_08615 [Micropepsaceae bacterium]